MNSLTGFKLAYTTDDDGIWLTHEKCDSAINLGHSPTVNDVFQEVMGHDCGKES